MALKDYYELSAMLRMQLPILLSFAVIRYLMGAGTTFWSKALVPRRFKPALAPLWEALTNVLSCIYGTLLATALLCTLMYHGAPTPPLVCSEFKVVRVHGLTCAVGLLALFTSGDPLTLALALCIFKAVSDGSVMVLFLSLCVWRSSVSMHDSKPMWFFGTLLTCNGAYGAWCYTDVGHENRTGGPILAACFAMLFLMARASGWAVRTAIRKVWSFMKTPLLLIPTRAKPIQLPEPVPDDLADPEITTAPLHEHKD